MSDLNQSYHNHCYFNFNWKEVLDIDPFDPFIFLIYNLILKYISSTNLQQKENYLLQSRNNSKWHKSKKLILILIGRVKCVRCPCGVADGLRGKHKWPLNSFFSSSLFLSIPYYFSAGRGCARNFSITVLSISDNSKI